jgi:hypothetical protein
MHFLLNIVTRMLLGKISIDGYYFHGKRDVEWDVAIRCG